LYIVFFSRLVVKSVIFAVKVPKGGFQHPYLAPKGGQRGYMLVRILSFMVALSSVACQSESNEQSPADGGVGVSTDAAPVSPMPDAAVNMAGDASEPAGGPDAGPTSILGFRSETVEYIPSTRNEVRQIPIHFWYPAAEPTETTALYKFFPRDDVFMNAPVALEPGAPVLLFSHGRRGFGEYSYFICEYFAKQGWLVAAVDHVGDRVSDGVTPDDIYSVRPQDISAMLDHITALPETHPLHGLASDKVALAGHSFGGYTTFIVAGAGYDVDTLRADCDSEWDNDFCRNLDLGEARFRQGFTDPRVKLAIPIAAGNNRLYEAHLDRIEVPVLMITGARDTSVTEEGSATPIWNQITGTEHRRVQFHQGGHFTFTNICSIIGPLGENNGCDDSFIPPDVAHPMVNAYIEAFVGRHLFGDESGAALIDGITSLHEDVELMKKE